MKRGIPAAVLVTERFIDLARATYESRDLPDGPMVVMPRTEDTEYSEQATMERIVDETFARFVAAMTAVAPEGPTTDTPKTATSRARKAGAQ